MEFSVSCMNTQNMSTFFSPRTPKQPLQWVPQTSRGILRMKEKMIKCRKNNYQVVELEKELQEIEKQGKEWREMKNCKGSVANGGGLVELLECLEKEAMMGDDEGREAADYDRRAQIFDKSSKVFQALKELNTLSLALD